MKKRDKNKKDVHGGSNTLAHKVALLACTPTSGSKALGKNVPYGIGKLYWISTKIVAETESFAIIVFNVGNPHFREFPTLKTPKYFRKYRPKIDIFVN
ncbi:MAG: hypothetical protein ACK4NC_03110 [Candidatus Gracilibacteria bacterium]